MQERQAWILNGFVGILLILVAIIGGVFMLIQEVPLIGLPLIAIGGLLASGVTVVQPNQSQVVIFFGKYLGSIRNSGLFVTVPLTIRRTISLRVRNFNSKKLKVNDVEGNPIEIILRLNRMNAIK
ncbi:hypothetical protein LC052_09895 [Priestia flexa]|nr:hypothetical protein [Priestia flexa]MCA1202179.1 hypothetical protein [Priestia flexa]